MTRRDALLLLPMLMQTADQKLLTGDTLNLRFITPKPIRWVWDLDNVQSITVMHKGESVTIDPAEIFAALQSPKEIPRDLFAASDGC